MSTRATYLFTGDEWKQDQCFYIHHDGYPEGAAYYVRTAMDEEEAATEFAPNRSPMEQFFRLNLRAEFTKDHEQHGDTEWRYTFTDRRIDSPTVEAGVVVVRNRGLWDRLTVVVEKAFWIENGRTEYPQHDKKWSAQFTGTVMEFLVWADPKIGVSTVPAPEPVPNKARLVVRYDFRTERQLKPMERQTLLEGLALWESGEGAEAYPFRLTHLRDLLGVEVPE